MAEYSFPVEEQPLPGAQWRSVTLGIGSGVLDEGGAPYRLINLDNATNSVTVAVDSITKYAHAILHGFYHKIDKNVPLTIPAVTTATTYYIALQLDTTRATAGDLPVKLGVHTSLDRTQDKDYLVLHRIERQPNQLLTDATITKTDAKIAPQLMVDEYESLPDPASVLWGTTAIVRLPHEVIYQSRGDAGGRVWLLLHDTAPADPEWIEYGDTSGYKWPGSGGRRGIRRGVGAASRRELKGRIARADDSDFNTGNPTGYLMMTLSASDIPAETRSFVTDTSLTTNPGHAKVQVSGTTGEVRAWVSSNCKWVSLDGISFDAKL